MIPQQGETGTAACRTCGNTTDWYHFKSGITCRPCALRKARERQAAVRLGAVVLTPAGLANVRSNLASAHIHDATTLRRVVGRRSPNRLIAPDGRPVSNIGRSSIIAIRHALEVGDRGFLDAILMPERECSTCGVPHHVATRALGDDRVTTELVRALITLNGVLIKLLEEQAGPSAK
jgi:hypothetical protein